MIVLVSNVLLALVLSQRTFSVSAQDNSGPRSEVKVYRFHRPIQETEEYESKGFLKRSKRRWSPPPFNILENDAGPFPKEIEKIVSDSSAKYDVYYTISGPGVDQYPVGVFSLNQNTGMLSVHKSVDREEFPKFTITTRVFDRLTNAETDLALPITVIVDDVNDNAPTFSSPLQFTVPEKCAAGTMVGKVNATDRDQEGSDHVKIRYSLLSGSGLFTVNPLTGVITTLTNTLDREVNEKQLVVVQIKDMDGAVNGLFNTGTATITLSDINDNPPTFMKSSYKVDVKENESDKLILRIPVEDKDLINTPNWISKFVISKGNEQGNFRIDTDPKTNEGLLFVSKALDYEQTNNIKLEIMARNEADLKGTTAQWQSIPVNVTVINVDEGPEFSAPTVTFTVKENSPNGTVIGSYTATDPETKSSNGIMYYKVKDPASWISVDRTTGELKVANTIDRESHFVQDGVYNVTMKAVDATSKTGTGTVIILVEDVNDNMPLVPSGELVLCEKEGELGSVMVVAEDKDQNPFSSPFSFSLGPGQEGTWSLERQNGTTAKLQQKKQLNTGIHEVPVKVMDLQGYGDEQKVKVRICQCKNGVCLAKPRSVSFGPFGILALLLPLALLLLLGLLLAFFCMMGREKIPLPDGTDSGGILLKSNTEAPGEEVDSSHFFPFPTNGFEQNGVKGSVMNADWGKTKTSSTMGPLGMQDSVVYKSGFNTNEFVTQYDNRYGSFGGGQLLGSGFDNRYLTQDSTFHHTWQTNGRCLHQKVGYLGNEDDGRYADDIVHSYGFEGVGSAAGSVGCCSDYSDNDNLEFLNTLGPKFKTLAETCTMKT